MSWHPNDLLTDDDLLAYEATILTQFGRVDWQDRRQKALEDWLWPILRVRGLDPQRFRTRFAPQAVYGYTSSAYTDVTSYATSTATDDINLATTLAASTDYLYVGAVSPFRGLSVRMLDAVSSVSATATVQVWTDTWQTVPLDADSTQTVSGKPFSGGGALTWTLPSGLVTRSVNSSSAYYWARLSLSAAPTGAKLTQVGCIRRSVLCGPVAMRTLGLIFQEAPTRTDGPWGLKAEWYLSEADRMLERAWSLLGGEFDTVTEDDQVDATEAAQTTAEAMEGTEGGWTFERA